MARETSRNHLDPDDHQLDTDYRFRIHGAGSWDLRPRTLIAGTEAASSVAVCAAPGCSTTSAATRSTPRFPPWIHHVPHRFARRPLPPPLLLVNSSLCRTSLAWPAARSPWSPIDCQDHGAADDSPTQEDALRGLMLVPQDARRPVPYLAFLIPARFALALANVWNRRYDECRSVHRHRIYQEYFPRKSWRRRHCETYSHRCPPNENHLRHPHQTM